MMTIDRPEVKTGELARLDAELLEYELAYQMTTLEFLLRVADPRDDLSDVEDATFWRATYEIAEKLRIEGEAPPGDFGCADDLVTEDSKESSVIFYGHCRLLRTSRTAYWIDKKAYRPRDHAMYTTTV